MNYIVKFSKVLIAASLFFVTASAWSQWVGVKQYEFGWRNNGFGDTNFTGSKIQVGRPVINASLVRAYREQIFDTNGTVVAVNHYPLSSEFTQFITGHYAKPAIKNGFLYGLAYKSQGVVNPNPNINPYSNINFGKWSTTGSVWLVRLDLAPFNCPANSLSSYVYKVLESGDSLIACGNNKIFKISKDNGSVLASFSAASHPAYKGKTSIQGNITALNEDLDGFIMVASSVYTVNAPPTSSFTSQTLLRRYKSSGDLINYNYFFRQGGSYTRIDQIHVNHFDKTMWLGGLTNGTYFGLPVFGSYDVVILKPRYGDLGFEDAKIMGSASGDEAGEIKSIPNSDINIMIYRFITAELNSEVMVLAFKSDFSIVWTVPVGTSQHEFVSTVGINPNGIYVSGSTNGLFPGATGNPANENNGFTALFNFNGVLQ